MQDVSKITETPIKFYIQFITELHKGYIYGLIMGDEDIINDHEILRHDPIFALVVGKVMNSEQELTTLAGKST